MTDGTTPGSNKPFSVSDFLSGLIEHDHSVNIVYKNWKGEVGIRHILPISIYWGKTAYHPVEQWLLVARDIDKDAERHFAMKDIIHWF